MALDEQALVGLVTEGFFGSLNRHDLDGAMAGWAEGCVMRIPGSGWLYEGKERLRVHLDDFIRTYATIAFGGFVTYVDVAHQRLAVRFEVTLIDHDGAKDVLRNANFFDIDADGRIAETIIYTSQPVTKGFAVGSS